MTPAVQPRRQLRGAPVQTAPTPGRHFLSVADLSAEELAALLDRAVELKRHQSSGSSPPYLRGKTAALLFQKPSLRTRVSFEVGMLQLGGNALYLSPAEVQLGQREAVPDVAQVLSRYVSVIVARVFLHEDVVSLAGHSSVPVINALSDFEHPCQVLADLLTLREHLGHLHGRTLAYVGDGNNVAHSLLLAAPRAGLTVRVASPDGYEPDARVLEAAATETEASGGAVELFRDPRQAVRGADAVYTDAWYSMGQEDEAELREAVFRPYQVNGALMGEAAPHALAMHCLPAHRGHEITDDVLDSPVCVAYDQAENRLHAQKALLMWLVGDRTLGRG